MSAGVRIKWHRQRWLGEFGKEVDKRMRHVGELCASQMRRNISQSTRANGPSLPGEMPHADEGTLRKSIVHDKGEKPHSVLVGSAIKYAVFLEHGTSNMAPRPFILRTVRELQPKIQAIFEKPIT